MYVGGSKRKAIYVWVIYSVTTTALGSGFECPKEAKLVVFL
jgi:hypothetical protein